MKLMRMKLMRMKLMRMKLMRMKLMRRIAAAAYSFVSDNFEEAVVGL